MGAGAGMIRFWRVRSLVGKAAIFAFGFGPPVLGAGDRLKSPPHHRAAEFRVVGADGPRRRRPDSDRPLRVGPPVQCRCIFTGPAFRCVSPRVSSADGPGTAPGWRCATEYRRTRRPPARGRGQAWSGARFAAGPSPGRSCAGSLPGSVAQLALFKAEIGYFPPFYRLYVADGRATTSRSH